VAQMLGSQIAVIAPTDLALQRNFESFEVDEVNRIATAINAKELDVLKAERNEKVQFVEHL
jgi:hypothetical protein